MSGHSQPQSSGDGWSGEPANHKFNSKVPANLCRTWEAGCKIPQCCQLRQTLFVNQDELVRDFSRLFSHSGGRCSCTEIVAVLMVLFREPGGPRNWLCDSQELCSTAGRWVDRGVPQDRKFKEFGAGMSALRGSEVPGSLSTAQTSRVVPVNGSSRLLMAF